MHLKFICISDKIIKYKVLTQIGNLKMNYRISDKLASMKPSAIREIFKSLTDPSIIAFAAGNPSPLTFPSEEIAEITARILKESPTVALQYGITEGYPKLRRAVAERLKARFSHSLTDNTLLITSGGQQALELTAKVMCSEGDAVICENPTFIGALNAFRSVGAKIVGVPILDDGYDIDLLEKACIEHPEAKILYTIPTFHNPIGICTSYEKRKQIYAIAKKYSLIILEDNPYGELRFEGEDIPTIKSMDTEGIVVYCGSFSKILSSGMRVGFALAPDPVAQKMVVAKQVEDVHTNQLFQMVCAEYMEKYDLDAHIERAKDIYRKKCSLMLSALDEYMPVCVKYTRPCGGLFVYVTLPSHINLSEFVKKALELGVAVVPGTAFNSDESMGSSSFRITYSTPSEEQIVRGVKILSELVSTYMK